MTSGFIGQYEYNDFCRKVRFGDYNLTIEKLIDICNYLDGKHYDDNGRIINNVLDDFIYQIIRKPYYAAEFPKEIIDFIKSDYFSDKVKKDIYKMTRNLDGYKDINKLLKSNINVNDFDLFSLNDISDAFYMYCDNKKIDKDINVKIPIIFNKYMFILDGEGPVEFIKNNYNEKELAKEFLTNVGLVPTPTYYQDNRFDRIEFNEDHLIAIYKQFEKYMPDKKEAFVKLVRLNKVFSAKEFISNYSKFVEDNFSCKSLNLTKDKKELKEESQWKNIVNDKNNEDIKNLFLKYVNKEKKELKKTI